MKVIDMLLFQYGKTVMNFHFPFLSSRAWDGDSKQKLGLCLLERCPPSLTLMNLQRSNRRAVRRAVPSGSCLLIPRKILNKERGPPLCLKDRTQALRQYF